MKAALLPSRHGGWAASEYLAVLVGLIAIWKIAHVVLESLQRSHSDFAWALMIPY